MSKGNMLLGQARGAVGDVVFSRLKGQQVTRARNRKPANPRSSSQVYQRALFSDAVKFYTRGRQNLYQFAFEGKKANESDYNAFMRENAKRGVVISKAAFDNASYPAIGNWVIAKGSLTPPNWTYDAVNARPYIQLGMHASSDAVPTTLAALSAMLINGDTIQEGDILTFVNIYSDKEGIPNVAGEAEGMPTWVIRQLQLDSTSAQPLSDYNIAVVKYGTGDNVYWHLTITDTVDVAYDLISTGAVVLSRNTTAGVKVATTELEATVGYITEVLDAARQRSYIDSVVESWRTTQQAPVVSESIMQGNIAQSIALDFDPAGE